MDPAALIITFFFVSFSGALMPGPLFAIALTESAKKGARAGFMVSLGHLIIEAPLATAILLGLGYIFEYEATIILISILGGLTLFWIGYATIKPALKGTATLKTSVSSTPLTKYGPVFGGILASASNPWFPLWWILISPSFLFEALKIGLIVVVVIIMAHWSVDVGWLSVVGLFVGKGREVMSDKTYRILIGACGGLILALSIYFVANGISLLLS